MVRIAGADVNGSDLLLPANLTLDRKSLMTETPLDKTPLSRGDHLIDVSLNGQQYGVPLLDAAVRNILFPNAGRSPLVVASPGYAHTLAA